MFEFSIEQDKLRSNPIDPFGDGKLSKIIDGTDFTSESFEDKTTSMQVN